MNRDIPVVLIRPLKEGDRENAPTVYMMNGADGGEGRANWINQTDVVQYYGGNTNPDNGPITDGIKANIVIPMSGAFSYYSDWVNDAPTLGGPQKWETYMTQELPNAIEPAIHANGKRALVGMSMSGTTSLTYAEQHPEMYQAIGSFSGCAATTSGVAPWFIDTTLQRGGTNMAQMWGGPNTEAARRFDALLNSDKLASQPNVYISNGSGLAGFHDIPNGDRANGNVLASATVMVEGGVIEAATNTCTLDLKRKTDAAGMDNIHYELRPQGTHQWGYWQDDLRGFWPQLTAGIGTADRAPVPAEKPVPQITPLSSLDPNFNR